MEKLEEKKNIHSKVKQLKHYYLGMQNQNELFNRNKTSDISTKSRSDRCQNEQKRDV